MIILQKKLLLNKSVFIKKNTKTKNDTINITPCFIKYLYIMGKRLKVFTGRELFIRI